MALRSYFGWRLVRLYLLAGAVTLLAVSYLLPDGISPSRLLDRETKLGVFDGRITGIDHEYLRRSPEMQALLAEYQACRPTCSPDFAARRDAVVAKEWPSIFERVQVEKDWISIPQTNETKKQLRELVKQRGSRGVIADCKPKIIFAGSNKTYPVFEKFECKPSGARAGG